MRSNCGGSSIHCDDPRSMSALSSWTSAMSNSSLILYTSVLRRSYLNSAVYRASPWPATNQQLTLSNVLHYCPGNTYFFLGSFLQSLQTFNLYSLSLPILWKEPHLLYLTMKINPLAQNSLHFLLLHSHTYHISVPFCPTPLTTK